MIGIFGTSIIAFLAIFLVCWFDYKRVPPKEFVARLEKPKIDLLTISISIFKILILSYATYVISRQVIGVPESEAIWSIGWNFPLAIVISLISSIPIVLYLAIRKKYKTDRKNKARLYFSLMLAIFISGLGQIIFAGVSSSVPLDGLLKSPILITEISLAAGLILTMSAKIHFDILFKMERLSYPEIKGKFLLDSFYTAIATVFSILVAASFWTIVI